MILIKNALFFSGDQKSKATPKNILINDAGKIEKISSENIAVNGNTQIIDATNKWLMPGFIDIHTHYDAEVIASPGIKESARHGVTTVILGSCSVSAVYNNAEDTSDCFTRVEAIPRETMLPLLEREKSWNNAKEWKAYVNQQPLGINVASFIGHSDIRMKAMGIERSLNEKETATQAERKAMEAMLNESLDAGFLGLSTMDSPWDKMDGERYWSHKTPSFYGSWKERKGLIKILREREAILQGIPNLVTRFNALNYFFASAGWFRKPLKTTMIAMMDLIGDRYILPFIQFIVKVVNRIGKGDFRMQSLPNPFTVYYDGVDSVMFEEFPSGEALRDLAKNLHQRDELISNPAFRKRFKKEIKNKFAPKVWHKDLSQSVIIEAPDPSLVGKNFYQLAEERGEHPVDTFLDTIIKYDKQIKWTTTIANDRQDKLPSIYNYPYNVIGFSDAGAHLNNMAFYNFPLKMLKNVKTSIDKGKPIMTIEKCVWRLTKEIADWFKIDRGFLAEGKVADLVILDPSKFDNINEEVHQSKITGLDCERLVNRNDEVVSQVLVNGKVIFEADDFVEGYGEATKYGSFLERVA